MRSLSAWIQQLGFLVFLAGLAEILLPAGDVRKTARLVVGLVVILAVIEPAIGWILDGAGAPAWRGSPDLSPLLAGREYAEEGARIAGAALAGVEEAWRVQAQRELAAFLGLIPGVSRAGVELLLDEGRILWVQARLAPEAGESGTASRDTIEDRARRLIQGILPGVPLAGIEIVWDEAAAEDGAR